MTTFSHSKMGMEEAMHRNGWYMPLAKGFVTLEYIEGVRSGKLWCPSYKDIRIKPCPSPPSKAELIDILIAETNRNNVQLGFGQTLPEKRWIIVSNHAFVGAFQFVHRNNINVGLGTIFENGSYILYFEEIKQVLPRIDHSIQNYVLKLIVNVFEIQNVISTILPDCVIFNKDYIPAEKVKKANKVAPDNSDGLFSGLPEAPRKKQKRHQPLKRFRTGEVPIESKQNEFKPIVDSDVSDEEDEEEQAQTAKRQARKSPRNPKKIASPTQIGGSTTRKKFKQMMLAQPVSQFEEKQKENSIAEVQGNEKMEVN